MSNELRRLGAIRATIVVVIAAAVGALGLSFSGLSVAGGRHAVATVAPEVARPAPALASAPGRTAPRRHRAHAASPRRKHCPPVNGVEFTVSVDLPCPKPLKGGDAPHLSARLRRAASRPRPVATGKAHTPAPAAGSRTAGSPGSTSGARG